MSAPMQEHLTLYLRHGFSLLPLHRPIATPNGPQCSCERPNCSSPGKHPFAMLAPHGLRDASSDEQTVRSWFESTSLNVGIATGAISGIIAVDIDPRHDGDESLAVLEAQFGPPAPDLPISDRWRGRAHSVSPSGHHSPEQRRKTWTWHRRSG